VYGLAAALRPDEFGGAVGDYLVGIHVGGGAAPGLEDVEHKLVVVRAVDHLLGRRHDNLGGVLVEQAELAVRLRGGLLYVTEGLDEATGEPEVANRKVFLCALGLSTVQGIGGDLDLAQ